MFSDASGSALGLDFGTTNSVVALANGSDETELVSFVGEHAAGEVFRSALCFWHDDVPGGLAHEAGPFAIAEYMEWPHDSRFIQSFKSVAASASFEQASVFEKRYRFEELGKMFLGKLVGHAGGKLDRLPEQIVVGRPVEYAGTRPNEKIARERYDNMFAGFGTRVHYVYEPLGAAFSYASRISEPATVMVADFGGGTSDFSIVKVGAPGAERRCEPLGSAGVGIAGDRFDFRIMDRLVLPYLGKGSNYRSFDKMLEIPRSYFADFADWSRLALMRNRRTLEELARLQKSAEEPEAIGRMISVIDNELGFPLYDSVGSLKRALSSADAAPFRFSGGGLTIEAEVKRADFESWIADDLAQIEAAVDAALAKANVNADQIDRLFLTGGSSLIPAIRAIFARRFGDDRIATGGELTSIAHGLALIGAQPDVEQWAV